MSEQIGRSLCYYPQQKVRARLRHMKAGRPNYELKALIPGYVFVRSEFADGVNWRAVKEVFGWVKANDKPLVASDAEIGYLMEQERIGNYDFMRQRFSDLLVGKKFLLHSGVLKGQTVMVQGIKHDMLLVSSNTSAIPFKISVANFQKMEHTCVG